MKAHQISRLQDLLQYIEGHLDQPLNLKGLAEITCWSRWQLQRVFQLAYEQSVMAYVRQQRLSKAARRLIESDKPINDIVFACGFESQSVFTRAFKDHFLKTPKAYRQQKQLINVMPKYLPPTIIHSEQGLKVGIKAMPSFILHGMYCVYNSVHSPNANNQEALYELWRNVRTHFHQQGIKPKTFHSVIDASKAINEYRDGITYWGGLVDSSIQEMKDLNQLIVPAQNYAVFTHKGKLESLRNTLLQFLLEWIPSSDYYCSDGLEVERHCFNQAPIDSDEFEMESWLPVQIRS